MNVGSKNSRIPQILEYVRKINEEFLFIRNDDTIATMLSVNDAMLLSNLFSCCIIPQHSLEPLCCTMRPKKVPDQLLV